jgi:hypothetical protein
MIAPIDIVAVRQAETWWIRYGSVSLTIKTQAEGLAEGEQTPRRKLPVPIHHIEASCIDGHKPATPETIISVSVKAPK